MKALELLRGKKINVKTDVGVIVTLEIKEVKRNHHSKEMGPSNQENDWWPPTEEWDTYTVIFTNGHKKEYDSIDEIEIV